RQRALVNDRLPRLRRKERIVDADALTVDARDKLERIAECSAARDERGSISAGANAVGPRICRFDKWYERLRHLEVREGVDIVPIELRRDLDLVALEKARALAADKLSVRAKADTLTGLRDKLPIRLENEWASVGVALRIEAASKRRAGTTEADVAGIVKGRGPEVRVRDQVGISVTPVRSVGRVTIANRVGLAKPVAFGTPRLVAPRIFEVHGDVATAFGEILPEQTADEVGASVPIFALASLAAEREPVSVLLKKEVGAASD